MLTWLGSLTLYGWIELGLLVTVAATCIGVVWDYERLARRVAALEQHITPTEPTGRHAKGRR